MPGLLEIPILGQHSGMEQGSHHKQTRHKHIMRKFLLLLSAVVLVILNGMAMRGYSDDIDTPESQPAQAETTQMSPSAIELAEEGTTR